MKHLLCCISLLGMLVLPVAGEEKEGGKYLALTFDDGPSGHYTAELLDGLAEREVHATFFLCGYRVEQFPKLTARIAAEGHELGVHGDSHRLFTEMKPREVCADLKTAREKILQAAGQEPTLLRPPGGCYDLECLRQTVCADLPVILWSVDPHDWCKKSEDAVAREVINKAKSGDVILLHDMSDSTVEATFQIIDTLEAQGFEFVTVSELAYLSGTQLKGSEAYYQFPFAKNASISAREAATEP